MFDLQKYFTISDTETEDEQGTFGRVYFTDYKLTGERVALKVRWMITVTKKSKTSSKTCNKKKKTFNGNDHLLLSQFFGFFGLTFGDCKN